VTTELVAAGWRKSTRSVNNGQCVEAGNDWRKSSRSGGNGQCVEAGNGTRVVLVRDTTDRGGPVLSFTARAWAEFTAGITGAGR
jgi:Domain of unknown function (DUF397)